MLQAVADKTPPALRVRTLGDLLAQQFPAREHLLHPVIRQGESMLLWAPTGVGKTMLVGSMALAMAGGGEVLGWTARRPWRVLLVDGEMAKEDLQERMRMLAGTVDGFDLGKASENLALMCRTDQPSGAVFPDIASTEGQEAVLREARRHRADLVVLDNFSTLAEVADENDAAAFNPVLAFLLRLKAERVACILVHHSGKSGTTYRGSSRLATTFEVILGLIAPEVHSATSGAAFSTEWTKFRGAPHPALTPRDVVLEAPGIMPARWTAQSAERDDMAMLVAAVRSGQYGTQKEIAAALGWDASKVTREKARAIAAGRITAHQFTEALEAVLTGRVEADDQGF